MMVETILESSQDFGMSNGSLPQWKRELLQRRAARARPPAVPAPPAPPPPPPATDNDDEELRYGPGIVKRLKSRYLSLALREAPRRRPSVLRRAASLEHLLDERPPPAPRPHARPARPVSLAAPSYSACPPRRDSVKRARSVDALSRLDSRDESPQVSLQPPPQPPPPPPSPPPPLPRTARPPRRPAPLLRDTERPPADVVRSTLRKFESAPPRRTAPAARVSAVLRGLEALPRSSTPEPRGRSPSPAAADLSAIDEPESTAPQNGCDSKAVSRAALDGIARAGSSVRYSFDAVARGSHLPPLAATNPVLLGRARLAASPRRVGVIRPMPAAPVSPTPSTGADETDDKMEEAQRIPSPAPHEEVSVKKDSPSALVEPIVRPPEDCPLIPQTNGNATPSMSSREVTPEPEPKISAPKLVNGHSPPKPKSPPSRIGAAGIERAWTGARGAGGGRPPPPASTSVVFNFSNRKEVPDYIENDGIILRANRRNRFKAGEAGIVVLRPEALQAESESEEEDTRPPSPLSVRFVNDNILINGKSSMAARPTKTKDRAAKLKLQFDDSLTRTFEYPSEISLCEDGSPVPANTNINSNSNTNSNTNTNYNSNTNTNTNSNTITNVNSTSTETNGDAPLAQPALLAPLAANTHIVSASLGRYTPSKTCADTFQLGLTRRLEDTAVTPSSKDGEDHSPLDTELSTSVIEIADAEENGDVRPCAAGDAPSWSESRTHATDLLF